MATLSNSPRARCWNGRRPCRRAAAAGDGAGSARPAADGGADDPEDDLVRLHHPVALASERRRLESQGSTLALSEHAGGALDTRVAVGVAQRSSAGARPLEVGRGEGARGNDVL